MAWLEADSCDYTELASACGVVACPLTRPSLQTAGARSSDQQHAPSDATTKQKLAGKHTLLLPALKQSVQSAKEQANASTANYKQISTP